MEKNTYQTEIFETILKAVKENTLVVKPAVKQGKHPTMLLCVDNGSSFFPIAELVSPGEILLYELKEGGTK